MEKFSLTPKINIIYILLKMDMDPDLIWEMGESMLKDAITTNAYDRLLKRCKNIFKDKVRMSDLLVPRSDKNCNRSSWTWAVGVDC